MTPIPDWLRNYRRTQFGGDLGAGLIVTVMLIPQSLAYAMLAGLPPEMGLYASILPLLAYALFGSSMTLAVGPVAMASLMTASALAPLAAAGSVEYAALAMQLALLSGLMLVAFGLLRLGFLAHFLSHPVISGFISGSALLIIAGQLKHILGVRPADGSFAELCLQLLRSAPQAHLPTLLLGIASIALLLLARNFLSPLLQGCGIAPRLAELLARLAPMLVVMLAIIVTAHWQLDAHGVSVVGQVPAGLPTLHADLLQTSHWSQLWLPALLISLVGFVESVSVAQSLALKRRERIHPDRELLGLGAANLASAVCGGYPVTGGFARSVVNFAAGANTPLAGIISALLMAIVISNLTGLLHNLPHAVLAATIIVAVAALIDLKTLQQAWRYDRGDALSLVATLLGVLVLGVEGGILTGVALSLATLVWRSSHPHIAVVGRVPGTEHFRNVERHQVLTLPGVLALRVDESLFFANASQVQAAIEQHVNASGHLHHVLLLCPAVNQIDSTALAALTALEQNLAERQIQLLLAEVKGPVMDKLRQTALGQSLSGRIYLSAHTAFASLEREAAAMDFSI